MTTLDPNQDAEQVSAVESTPATPTDQEELVREVAVQTPQFAEMTEGRSGDGTTMERFYDVNVTVWAELGRVSVPLGHLVQIGEGTVMKLDRPISAPVDLMAQGVRMARGEVVVVDDCFAIRVKEIEPSRKAA